MSRTSSASEALAPSNPDFSPRQRALIGIGGVIIAATWVFLVLARPGVSESLTDTSGGALITLIGYLLGTVALLVGVLPSLPARVIAIIPLAVIANAAIGQIVGSIGIPLYVDAVGTVLIAALAGPAAGLTTGAVSSVVWGLFNPTALPFAAVGAAVGWMAGAAIRRGAFKAIWRIVVSGAVIGIVAGMLSAPIAAFVYGGTAGVGTGALVSLFREVTGSLISSVTLQSVVSDPLDKIIVLLLVWAIIRALPKRTLATLRPASTHD